MKSFSIKVREGYFSESIEELRRPSGKTLIINHDAKTVVTEFYPFAGNEKKFNRYVDAIKTLKKPHRNITRMLKVYEVMGVKRVKSEYYLISYDKVIFDGRFYYNDSRLLEMVKDLFTGLAYLHYLGLVHRDIKPSNILIADDGTLKIADYETARRIDSYARQRTNTFDVGTETYWEPTQHLSNHQDEPSDLELHAKDIYAAGGTLFEALARRLLSDNLIESSIHNVLLLPKVTAVNKVAIFLIGILENCTSFSWEARPSAADIQRRISKYVKTLKLDPMMLDFDIQERRRCDERTAVDVHIEKPLRAESTRSSQVMPGSAHLTSSVFKIQATMSNVERVFARRHLRASRSANQLNDGSPLMFHKLTKSSSKSSFSTRSCDSFQKEETLSKKRSIESVDCDDLLAPPVSFEIQPKRQRMSTNDLDQFGVEMEMKENLEVFNFPTIPSLIPKEPMSFERNESKKRTSTTSNNKKFVSRVKGWFFK